jgi:hypothetical protein
MLSNASWVAWMMMVWKASIVQPNQHYPQYLIGKCLNFKKSRRYLMLSKYVMGLSWSNKYKTTTNWTIFFLSNPKPWLTNYKTKSWRIWGSKTSLLACAHSLFWWNSPTFNPIFDKLIEITLNLFACFNNESSFGILTPSLYHLWSCKLFT